MAIKITQISKDFNMKSKDVLDMFKEGEMYGNMKVWCDKFMPDGLHPNDMGHEIIADKLQKFLENL